MPLAFGFDSEMLWRTGKMTAPGPFRTRGEVRFKSAKRRIADMAHAALMNLATIMPSETAFVSASFAFPIISNCLLAPEGKRVSA